MKKTHILAYKIISEKSNQFRHTVTFAWKVFVKITHSRLKCNKNNILIFCLAEKNECAAEMKSTKQSAFHFTSSQDDLRSRGRRSGGLGQQDLTDVSKSLRSGSTCIILAN